MPKWECGICGNEHSSLPLDIAYAKPDPFFEIPEEEREDRVWFSGEQNADLCVIDGKTFLIRGFLPIPVLDGERRFAHGVWVLVEEASFRKYVGYEGDGTPEPPFTGHLSTEIPGYPSTYLLEADVHLLGPSDRPLIKLRASDHPLAVEQREGITMARVHEIVEAALPQLFE